MRFVALLCAAAAVTVWWHPMSPAAQCALLGLLGLSMLSLRSADRRARQARAEQLRTAQQLAEARGRLAAAENQIPPP